MPYIRRNETNKIISVQNRPQPNETLEKVEENNQELLDFLNNTGQYSYITYADLRKKEYPLLGDMVDAICKWFDGDNTELRTLQDARLATKLKYPKE